jgi:hypothetical protein
MNQAPAFILRIYVSRACRFSERVTAVTDEIRCQLPELLVEVIDIETALEPLPDVVFSVPTYILNGCVISLGNPDANFADELRALMNAADSCKIEL